MIPGLIFLKQYSFFLQIFTAFLCIMASAKKRSFFWLRAVLCVAVSFPFYWLPTINVLSINIDYFIALLALIVYSFILFKESVYTLLFNSFTAFGLQHLSWNVMWIILGCASDGFKENALLLHLLLLMIFVPIYGFVFYLSFTKKLQIEYRREHWSCFIFSTIIIFIVLILSQLVDIIGGGWNIVYRLYTLMAVLLAIVIQFFYPYAIENIRKETELKNQKETLEKLLALQSQQQKLAKETDDIINMKFHDMKQQLLLLKGLHGKEKEDTIEELEQDIDIYSKFAKTGNEALDIVLTQKGLLCSNKQIRFTYIIDGKALDFLEKVDITSLFGNIVDNAMEAVEKENDEFRLIKLQAQLDGGFLRIEQVNYSHQEIKFKDKLPVSNKKDNINHGYGMKSICYIVEKYNGQVKTDFQNNVFSLFILIPLPTVKAENK